MKSCSSLLFWAFFIEQERILVYTVHGIMVYIYIHCIDLYSI